MTLRLRVWRYGSRASARHTEDPVGRLTLMAQREAHVGGGAVSSALQRWDSTVPTSWLPTGRDFGAPASSVPVTGAAALGEETGTRRA